MNDFMMQLAHASFQGGVIIAVIFALRLVLRKAPKSILCLLWLLAIARLLLPIQLESSLSLQPDVAVITQQESQQPGVIIEMPKLPAHVAPSTSTTIKTDDGQLLHVELTYSNETVVPEQSVTIDWAGLLPWLWLAVAAGLAIWSVLSYLRLCRHTKNAVVLGDGIWLSPELDSAFVLGYLKPQVYLPAKLDQAEQTLVISHEQAHIRRFDHWYKLLGFAAVCIHWFNPLVWLAYIFLCRDMEMACDEQVVRDMDTQQRKAYSMALLRCSADNHHFKPCPVAFAEVSVKDRIKGVLNYKKPGFWMTLVGIVAVVFVAVCFLTSPASSDDLPPREVKNLLTTYLDAMKEDMEEAASYHYFSNPTTAWAYKESKDYLTEYEILNWEKLGQGLWVAEVNLKYLSYDDWASYYHFIGKIDGQYRVVYHYDVHATDHFSDDIDLSLYKSTDPNAMIPDDMRQHCIDLMKQLRAKEYRYLSFTVAFSDPEHNDEYIRQIEMPGFYFLEELLYEDGAQKPHYQLARIAAQDGAECYEREILNPGDTWVQKANHEMKWSRFIPEYLNDDPADFKHYPMEICEFEDGIWCVFDATDDVTVKKNIEFHFDTNGKLASIVIRDFSSYGESVRTYDDLWKTDEEIQRTVDSLLNEARHTVAFQQQFAEIELTPDEIAISDAIEQHFAHKKSILLGGVTDIPEMAKTVLRDELKHKQAVDADPLKWVHSKYIITEITLNEKGYSEALVTETVYYEIDDETLEDNTLDEVIVHIMRLSNTDGHYRVEEDAYRERYTGFDSCTFSASKLEQTQKRIVAEAVEQYMTEFQARIFYLDATVIPEMHPLRLQDLLKHKKAMDDAGIQQISSVYNIQEITLWDREYAEVTLTETATFKIDGELREAVIDHNIYLIGLETNCQVIDDGYYEPFSGFRSNSFVDPSELPD